MKKLDCIVGFIDPNGVLQVQDSYVNSEVQQTLDTALGGTNDILAKNGGYNAATNQCK
jgi:hypothetical protein